MDRRRFLTISAALALGGAAGAGVEGDSGVRRFTETVSDLQRISMDRRIALAVNAESKTPAELNALIPETEAIELSNGAAARDAGPELRVIAWNMERGRHWREGVQLIQSHPALERPDVLLLGEMDLGMERSKNENTTREFAKALGLNYVYGVEFLELPRGAGIDRPDGNDGGYHGNAILSAFPMTNVRMLRFPGVELWYGSDEHRLGGRMALFADIVVGGKTVTLATAHLESNLREAKMRLAQGQAILAELDAHSPGSPVILGGDFNAMPGASVIRAFEEAGFPAAETNDLSGGTMQERKNGKAVLLGKPIDYILARGLTTVKDPTSPCRVMAVYPQGDDGTDLSDHAIVTVKVRF